MSRMRKWYKTLPYGMVAAFIMFSGLEVRVSIAIVLMVLVVYALLGGIAEALDYDYGKD